MVTNGGGRQEELVGGFTTTVPCGDGAGGAVASLGFAMGILAVVGIVPLSRQRKKKNRT